MSDVEGTQTVELKQNVAWAVERLSLLEPIFQSKQANGESQMVVGVIDPNIDSDVYDQDTDQVVGKALAFVKLLESNGFIVRLEDTVMIKIFERANNEGAYAGHLNIQYQGMSDIPRPVVGGNAMVMSVERKLIIATW
jgi:hypothetical protein